MTQILTLCPPHDPHTQRMSDAYTDTDKGNYILRAFDVVDMTPDEAHAYKLHLCHEARRNHYPSVGDQLDALYKARSGDASEMEKIDAMIASVKAQFPKA